MPYRRKNSRFRCSKPVLILIAVYATGAELFNIYLNASQLSPKMFIGNLLMIAGAVIFALTRHKYTILLQVMKKIWEKKNRRVNSRRKNT